MSEVLSESKVLSMSGVLSVEEVLPKSGEEGMLSNLEAPRREVLSVTEVLSTEFKPTGPPS